MITKFLYQTGTTAEGAGKSSQTGITSGWTGRAGWPANLWPFICHGRERETQKQPWPREREQAGGCGWSTCRFVHVRTDTLIILTWWNYTVHSRKFLPARRNFHQFCHAPYSLWPKNYPQFFFLIIATLMCMYILMCCTMCVCMSTNDHTATQTYTCTCTYTSIHMVTLAYTCTCTCTHTHALSNLSIEFRFWRPKWVSWLANWRPRGRLLWGEISASLPLKYRYVHNVLAINRKRSLSVCSE